MIYPVWNGTLPARLKGFLEQVFRPAFTFLRFNPDQPLGVATAIRQPKRLTGKTARVVATMQMPAFVYRWYFHPHPEKNTLRLGGIRPIRESLIGLVEAPDPRKREQWLVTPIPVRLSGVDGPIATVMPPRPKGRGFQVPSDPASRTRDGQCSAQRSDHGRGLTRTRRTPIA